jgi:hypothetical protein
MTASTNTYFSYTCAAHRHLQDGARRSWKAHRGISRDRRIRVHSGGAGCQDFADASPHGWGDRSGLCGVDILFLFWGCLCMCEVVIR